MPFGARGSMSRSLSGRLNRANWGNARGVSGAPHIASNIQVPSSGTRLLGGAGGRPNLTPPVPRPGSIHIGTQGTMGSPGSPRISSFSRGPGFAFDDD